MKQEIKRLVDIGVLRKAKTSGWGAPTFIIPKKNGTVRFISDFRELNKRIKRKPYPMPRIQDMLLGLEGFKYATSLDLNMGYYHIVLDNESATMCSIVTPWGKYEYVRLPMGLNNSPDIFQEKMGELFQEIEAVRAYLDDLLIITKGTWEEHLEVLDRVLKKLTHAGLKVNAEKSSVGTQELEYLGYWVSTEGIAPLASKVDAILNIEPPQTKRQLRRFIGLVNYYRDAWFKRSEILAPLTALTSKHAKWKWSDLEQEAFDKIKRS